MTRDGTGPSDGLEEAPAVLEESSLWAAPPVPINTPHMSLGTSWSCRTAPGTASAANIFGPYAVDSAHPSGRFWNVIAATTDGSGSVSAAGIVEGSTSFFCTVSTTRLAAAETE